MEPFWIWQQADWPHFRWQDSEVLPRLRHAQRRLGMLIGSHSKLGNSDQTLDTLLANSYEGMSTPEREAKIQARKEEEEIRKEFRRVAVVAVVAVYGSV
ncbi:DUF4172 domain-containing protein [Aeromonas salmonicida]|uniref:DUF4172 domain-containing protein n=1 Tax=Aeromonas salmonicida TaxID=645 RepID=UPI00259D3B55|nr:DUF4172 domain-containing protein [Aeromonas salmonicida]MDM5103848.1 DUF4172 domain-containing protein [Aeromonas salmonicida]